MLRDWLRCVVAVLVSLCLTPAIVHAQPLLEPPVKIRGSQSSSDDSPPPRSARADRDYLPRSSFSDPDPIPPTRRRAKFSDDAQGTRVSADLVEKPRAKKTVHDIDDDVDEFRYRRSRLGKQRDDSRASAKIGDRLKDLLDPDKRRDWLFSDHAFDNFATPISNPFLFEDPRALTEIRPIFIYQKIPSIQPNFQGGNVWFLGTRASIAITERFSVTLNKLGGIAINPGGGSPHPSDFGLSEIWVGPKVTILRDPGFGSILAAGAIFQIPTGSSKAFQDTGSLSVVPYASYGKTLTEFRNLGSINGIVNGGYSFSTNKARSDYLYLNAHVDMDLLNRHRFYPVAELNWFQYTTNGTTNTVSGEGRDLFNFGSQAKGSNLLTGALGFRFKIIEAAQLGATFELPLLGNRDVSQYRFTVDMIFRY